LAGSIGVLGHGRVIAAGASEELKAEIGGQVVEARPIDRGDLQPVARILAEVAGAEGSIDQDSQLVTVPVPDPGLLRTASRALDEAGIVVAGLALRRPSLDEVFLALTGPTAEDGTDDSERSIAGAPPPPG